MEFGLAELRRMNKLALATLVALGCGAGPGESAPADPELTACASCNSDAARDVSTAELIEWLAGDSPDAWREAVIRLAHRLPGAGAELDDRVGLSPTLDERLEMVLAIALVYTLPVDALAAFPGLAALARPKFEQAAEYMKRRPLRAPGTTEDFVEPGTGQGDIEEPKGFRPYGGFVIPYLVDKTRSPDVQVRAAALQAMQGMPAAAPAVSGFLDDGTKVSEFHGDYFTTSCISIYAARVVDPELPEGVTFEVEALLESFGSLTEPYGSTSVVANLLRHRGTMSATTWAEWWQIARPMWRKYWQALAQGEPSYEDLLNLGREEDGFQLRRVDGGRSFRLIGPAGRRGRILIDGSVEAEGLLPLLTSAPGSSPTAEVEFDDCLIWSQSFFRTENEFEPPQEWTVTVREPTPAELEAAQVTIEPAPPERWWTRPKPCPDGAIVEGAPLPAEIPNDYRVACRKADGTLHGPETRFYFDQRLVTSQYWNGARHGVQINGEHDRSVYWRGRPLPYYRPPGCERKPVGSESVDH